MNRNLVLVSALVVGLGGSVVAQVKPGQPAPVTELGGHAPASAPAATAAINAQAPARGSELVGQSIEDRKGRALGEVADLVVPESAEVFVVVKRASGGLVCVPLSSFEVPLRPAEPDDEAGLTARTARVQRLVFTGPSEVLLTAESIVTPGAADANVLERSREHFGGARARPAASRASAAAAKHTSGISPSGKPDASPPGLPAAVKPLCLEKLLGLEVADVDGERVGEVKETAVDLGSSQVAYVVISTPGITGTKLQGLALERFTRSENGAGLKLGVTSAALKSAGSGLDLDRLPMRPSLLQDSTQPTSASSR